MWKTALLVALIGSTAACAASTDDADEASSSNSAVSQQNVSCRSKFAEWRLEHDRISKSEDRAWVLEGSWDVGTGIALACVAVGQAKDIPADVAAHALASAQQDCDASRKALQRTIAEIQAAKASEEERAAAATAGQEWLADQAKECRETLALYRKMSSR